MQPYEQLQAIVEAHIQDLLAERERDARAARARAAATPPSSLAAVIGLALIRVGAWLRRETWTQLEWSAATADRSTRPDDGEPPAGIRLASAAVPTSLLSWSSRADTPWSNALSRSGQRQTASGAGAPSGRLC